MVKLGSHDYVHTLRGQTLRFPNLNLPMKDWPKGISPHYEDLLVVQHTELKNLFTFRLKLLGQDIKAYDICASTDCPYCAATWFPKASWAGLRLGAQAITFLYLWDDAIDTPELTDLFNDLGASNRFREETRMHFDRYLSDDASLLGDATTPPISAALRSFIPIGEACAFRMTRGQRTQVLDQLHRYVDACEIEQLSELSGQAPTIEEYLKSRMGTSAVGFIVACLEYIVGIDLGDTIRSDRYVKAVFDETVFNIAIVNDILSLRRELRYPYYNNAVAVLYHEHQDLQKAVDETYKIILRSIETLEEAARKALDKYPDRREDLTAWIDGCKNMCTGNMAWSLHIARYSLGVKALDGTTEIAL
ncbi:isoprenoid synthase domain-containing protein [Mycena capillaripes]|nr:isoprenoid synthase domain-containing protein [Mycena capillaripes]